MHRGLAEEAVLCREEARHAHDVNRATLQELRGSLLPEETNALVVVDPLRVAPAPRAPEEVVKRHHCQSRVGLGLQQRLHRGIDILRGRERRRALEEHQQIRLIALALRQKLERVQQGRLRRGRVASQLRRAPDHFGAILARDRPDLGIIGGNHHAVDGACLPGVLNRPGDQRLPGQVTDVLPGHALRAATRRDDGQRAHVDLLYPSWPPCARRRRAPSARASVGNAFRHRW